MIMRPVFISSTYMNEHYAQHTDICYSTSSLGCPSTEEQILLAYSRSNGSDLTPDLSALFGDRTSDGGSLHFSLFVDNDTGVVFEVDEDTFPSSPSLALTDNDGKEHLLTQVWLTLLDRGQDHVTGTSLRETIQTRTDTLRSDHVEVLGSRVIRTVDKGCDIETQGH